MSVRWWRIAFSLLLALVPIGAKHLFETGLVDDAYIFCRYARHILDGQGAVFNAGEHVEGFTSPLHLGLVTALTALGVPPPAAAHRVSLAMAFALLLVLGSVRFGADRAGRFAALFTALFLPVTLWAASGMDATGFALVVVLTAWCFERSLDPIDGRTPNVPAAAWLLAGFAYWMRPEGALLPIAGWLATRQLPRRRRVAGLLIAQAPIAALTLVRWAYYGALLPNTFYAKVGGGRAALWGRGLVYLVDGALGLAPFVALIVIGLIARHRVLGRLPFVSWALVLLLGAMVFEGGDHFAMLRFFVPVAPLVALLADASLAAIFVSERRCLTAGLGLAAALGGWSVLGPSLPHPSGLGMRQRFVDEVRTTRVFDYIGRHLRDLLGPRHRLAIVTVGALPYRTDWEVVDLLGLTDPHVARLPRRLGLGTVGHEKFDSAHALGRRPDLVILHPWLFDAPLDAAPLADTPFLHAAQKDLLRHPAFQRDFRLTWVRLPAGWLPVYQREVGN